MVSEVGLNFMLAVVDFDEPNLGKLPDAQKIGILMISEGGKGVEVFNMLSLTDKSSSDEVIAVFDKYCQPKKNTVYEWIVLGVNDPILTELMLRDSALTLKKAEDLCRIYEASKRQTDDIHGTMIKNVGMHGNSGEGSQTLFLNNGRKPSTLQKCKFCGFSDEYGRSPVYDKQCRKCKAMNNFEAVCKNSAAAVNPVSNMGGAEDEGYDDQCSCDVECVLGLKSSVQLELILKMFSFDEDSLIQKYSGKFKGLGKIPGLNKAIKTPGFNIPMLEDITAEFASTTVVTVFDMKQGLTNNQRARRYGVKFNPEKIQLRMPSVLFMGVVVMGSGVAPHPKHVKAIENMPCPGDKKTDKPLEIQADSSQNGIGSVLLQDGHPLAFASRALTDAEQRYSHIEKDLLACVFAVEKFHHFTYDKVSPRLQRLLLRLVKYNVIMYLLGKEMYIADALSRAYSTDEETDPSYTLLTAQLQIHQTYPSGNLRERFDSDDAKGSKWGRSAVSIPNDLLPKPSAPIIGCNINDTVYSPDPCGSGSNLNNCNANHYVTRSGRAVKQPTRLEDYVCTLKEEFKSLRYFIHK
ncbi:hypothetical protein PR048_000117 [Dryococelus australis]|uniref:Reverse transcriptase/retrotransposon-derived protein RNase H-like domain-containing protein n=1 Tax=Dryococelus australis TaxID=614101 RepID=A0ABQ9IDR9_9NEOP|nr:hypothetical protein PR048_000117 [Dryococelus australis]